MRRIITTIIVLLFGGMVLGQSVSDAINFSQVMYQGTAKAAGMANALGAVGGDQTSISINPACMGIYRNGEFNMSLGLLGNTTKSSYYNTDEVSSRFRLNIPNVGFVSTKERSNYSFIRFTQFGVSMNRTNDYNIFAQARGFNPNSSLIDYYLKTIDGLSPEELEQKYRYTIYPAWQTYLIDTVNGYYITPVSQGNLWQNQEKDFKGRAEEWTFAFSANCMDRLFIGGSIGLTHLKRFGSRTYKEEVPSGYQDNDFLDWTFTEDLSSTGVGANLKLGFIFHANTWFRFGVAFHSPTIYCIDETWQTETENRCWLYEDKYSSPSSSYEYRVFTPLKWVGSMAFVGHKGLISIDVEYTNFAKSMFKDTEKDSYDYRSKNAEIANTYNRTLNFRIGAEYMMRSSYIRAGIAYYGSPLGIGETNGSIKKASLGLSLVASEVVTFDFAYEMTHGIQTYYLYNYENLHPVTQRQFRSNVITSMRIKF